MTGEEVAKQAGLSPATFYTVFNSKGEMFTEVFRELVLQPIPGGVELLVAHGGRGQSTR